jgi:hypothetical protein
MGLSRRKQGRDSHLPCGKLQLPDRYRVKTKSSARPRSTPLNPPRRQPSWVTSHHHGRRAPLLRLFTNHDMEEAWGRGVAGRRRRGDRARGQGGTRGEATLLVEGDLLEELQAGRSFWSGATSSSSAGRDRGRSRRSRWRSSCSSGLAGERPARDRLTAADLWATGWRR